MNNSLQGAFQASGGQLQGEYFSQTSKNYFYLLGKSLNFLCEFFCWGITLFVFSSWDV